MTDRFDEMAQGWDGVEMGPLDIRDLAAHYRRIHNEALQALDARVIEMKMDDTTRRLLRAKIRELKTEVKP